MNHIQVCITPNYTGMLNDPDYVMQDSAVRCMETLSLANKEYWKAIRDYSECNILISWLRKFYLSLNHITL